MAVTPPLRSCDYAMGWPGVSEHAEEDIGQGNRFAAWMVLLIGLALEMNLGLCLQNLSSSWPVWLVDYCRFYMRWRKRTAMVSNTEIKGHRTLCRGGRAHLVLRGRCKEKKKNWTRIAQSCPRGVALALAYGLASVKGLAVWRGKFDPALAGHKRIGEAGHPGPRRSRGERSSDLRTVGLVDARTLALQDKAWAGFCKWAYTKVTPDAFRSAMSFPLLLAELISLLAVRFSCFATCGRLRTTAEYWFEDFAGRLLGDYFEVTAREECGAAFEAFDSGRQSYRALFGEGLWEAGLRSPLYGGSRSAFRRRWDAILESLLVPTELAGGLRGGGCIRFPRWHGDQQVALADETETPGHSRVLSSRMCSKHRTTSFA